MIIKIDHIGIAVSSLEEAVKLFCNVLGCSPEIVKRETNEEQKVKVAMLPVGESHIELLESTDPEGVIAKFISKRGEGIHHIAIGVSDVKVMLEVLKKKAIPLVDAEPKAGAGGSKTAFLHPKATKALIELVEH